MKTLLTLILLVSSICLAFCQPKSETNHLPKYYKNAIVVSAGGTHDFYNFYVAGFVQFERIIHSSPTGNIFGVSIGTGASTENYIPLIIRTYGLFGIASNKFELALGITRTPLERGYHDKFSTTFISGIIGYRYQNPTKRFLFRIGAGFPELITVGLGKQF